MAENIDASIQILTLLVIGYVTQSKLFNLPELEFLYLKNGSNNGTCFKVLKLSQSGS